MAKFDEEQYLKNYPDVAAAVGQGKFQNGEEHFNQHGKSEGRSFEVKIDKMMTKRSSLASHENLWAWIGQNFNHKDMNVLEIGSRSVSSNALRTKALPLCNYTGFDVIKGPNVDVVGDAHRLSDYFEKSSFDLIFSFAVFEHLAMPWIVSTEIAKLLKPNGITAHETHFSFSEHELPWHFFQFNSNALEVLFCEEMGFELVDSGLDNPIDGVFSNSASEYLAGQKVEHLYCHSSIISKMTDKKALKSFQWISVADRIKKETMYPLESGKKWLED